MTITISIGELLLGLLILAGTGVLIALMIVIIKLIPGIKDLNRTLANAASLTDEAVAGVNSAKEIVSKAKDAVSELRESAKGKAAGSLKSAVAAGKKVAELVNTFKKNKEKDDTENK